MKTLCFRPKLTIFYTFTFTIIIMPTNVQTTSSSIAINRTLRNTYQLLSATLLFSGLMAYLSMYLNLPYFGLLITLGGYFGLLFLVTKLRNSASGILAVFALTGFMGLTLGPIIGAYTTAFSNGSELVAMAMTGTAAIFLSLSFYAIVSQKDFSFLAGFLDCRNYRSIFSRDCCLFLPDTSSFIFNSFCCFHFLMSG